MGTNLEQTLILNLNTYIAYDLKSHPEVVIPLKKKPEKILDDKLSDSK